MIEQAREWLADGIKLIMAPKASCLIPRRKLGEGLFFYLVVLAICTQNQRAEVQVAEPTDLDSRELPFLTTTFPVPCTSTADLLKCNTKFTSTLILTPVLSFHSYDFTDNNDLLPLAKLGIRHLCEK